jgi:superfamily II DNA or RNA helicase
MSPRYQLGSACGTGKTLTGRWHAQACQADVIVVFLPSLALLAQTLAEWRRAADPGWPWEAIVVCSDKSTAPGAAERAAELGGDVDRVFWAKAAASVTTDPGRASSLIRNARAARRRFVVFSTYHSAPVVASAARLAGGVVFDLMICDEAHHLAMRPAESFRTVLDDRRVRARKRLFMTATRVITEGDDVLSMDDEGTFGPVAHKVTFAQGIAMRRLVDYQVLVIADERVQNGRSRRDRAGDLAVPGAVLAAAAGHQLRTMLSFHTYIKDAAAFARLLNNITLRNGRRVKARHVSARDRGADRAATLAWLGEDTGGRQLRLVSSARCLAEGIDVPAVDAVMFADPRNAVVGIIQAVGRALRAAPGKQIATIIVPVTLSENADDSELLVSSFGNVWAVLRALRAHDERLAAEIETAAAAARGGGAGGHRRPVGRVKFLLPANVRLDEEMLRLRMVEAVAADTEWERFYQAYRDWQQATGGGYMPFNTCWKNMRVGLWVRRQMIARKEGRLPAARAARLEATPGWVWDQEDGHFRENLRRIAGLAASRPGGLTQPPAGPSIYAGLKEARRRLPLGEAAAGYRQLQRDGMLPGWQAALLAKQAGWDWTGGLAPQDIAMIQRLRMFAEFEKHGDVPRDHVEDGQPLGRWCQDVRRRKVLGALHPALEEEIAAATPRTAKGQPTFPWHQLETQWHLGYEALRAFAAREGTAAVPPGHVETLPCGPVSLGNWCIRQRYLRRQGELGPAWEKMLAAVPGWDWDPPGRRAEAGEKLPWLRDDLHGRPYAIQAGCTCPTCLATRRADDRAALQRRKIEVMDALGGPVPAGPATRHITGLERDGGKRGLIAEVSGVPLGVVRQVANGTAEVIAAKHAGALMAVTMDTLQSAGRTRAGSRGRAATVGAERIPVEPTRRLLADLKRRGFGANWVARELGYATTEIITPHQWTVTRRVADQVAGLHDCVGDLIAPKAYRTQKVPPLDELLRIRQLIRAQERTGSALRSSA